MSASLRSEIEAAVRAFTPAERDDFIVWLLTFLAEGGYEMRERDVVRMPEDYEAFDPAAHDHVTEV